MAPLNLLSSAPGRPPPLHRGFFVLLARVNPWIDAPAGLDRLTLASFNLMANRAQ
jgi:hypothetical protein